MLSVAMITYNEEDNIRDALESIRWADEIVVVDSQSTDRTQEICREYTDKVYTFEWQGFAHQKSRAVSLTSNPWVLVLDADERVTEGLRDEIISLLGGESQEPLLDGYYIARRNYFSGRWMRHGGWWPDYTLRLFRKDRGRFEPREVHECIRVDGRTGHLRHPMEHYTYRDIGDYLRRMDFYSTLAAREMFKAGRRAGILDITLRPLLTFCRMCFLRLGILDGIYGMILAGLYSAYTFSKYSKLWEMWKGLEKP